MDSRRDERRRSNLQRHLYHVPYVSSLFTKVGEGMPRRTNGDEEDLRSSRVAKEA